MNQTSFDAVKATQVVARFLAASGGECDYLKLVKLLYLLERTSLIERSRPVMDDECFSLRAGPVVSHLMDLASGAATDEFWSAHLARMDNVIVLLASPGNGELSETEERLIDVIWTRYGGMTTRELVDFTHTQLAEYEDPGSGRKPIPVEAILKAGKKTPTQIAAITKDMHGNRLAATLLGAR